MTLSAPSTAAQRPGAAGDRAGRSAEPVPYDFRRPIQLSREHSRVLQLGLDGFARQATTVFTSALRTECAVQLLSISQEPYAEYVDSLQAPTYITKFSADPFAGQGVLEIPLPVVMACFDLMLGGPGGLQPVRPLTEIEAGIVRSLLERLLEAVGTNLSGIVDLAPVATGIEYSPQFAQVAGPTDVMIVATFDVRVNERPHQMTICLPFVGMQPHLVKAVAPAPVSDRERSMRVQAAQLVRRRFEDVPVAASVRFRGTHVDPQTLSSLAPGDVLRLAHPASAPLDVTIEDTTFAHATPGAKGPRLAALIVGTPKEN